MGATEGSLTQKSNQSKPPLAKEKDCPMTATRYDM
jgi:hypothetical protein